LQIISNILFHPETFQYHFQETLPNVTRHLSGKVSCPLVQIDEALHGEAFRYQPLAQPLYPDWNVDAVNYSRVDDFRQQVLNSATVIGVGVESKDLLQWANGLNMKPTLSSGPVLASKYVGKGEVRIPSGPLPTPTHVALAFEGESLNGSDYLVYRVLTKLVGQGSSGPSRHRPSPGHSNASHFAKFVSKNPWLQHVETRHVAYSDSGLFIVGATAQSPYSDRLPQVLADQVKSATSSYSDTEISAAKALLKRELLDASETTEEQFNHLVQTSSSSAFAKDGAKAYKSLVDLAKSVETISKADVERVSKRILASKPSLVAHGDVLNLIGL